ncbi:unnamed protein product, partial [Allacma fusca]
MRLLLEKWTDAQAIRNIKNMADSSVRWRTFVGDFLILGI